jgi:serine protease inhibitor
MNLQIFNKMYIQNGFNVLKDFRKLARKSFGSGTKEVDFVKNWEKARRTINQWVEKKTRQKITQIVAPGKCCLQNYFAITPVYCLNKLMVLVLHTKMQVFWDVTLCHCVCSSQAFKGLWCVL